MAYAPVRSGIVYVIKICFRFAYRFLQKYGVEQGCTSQMQIVNLAKKPVLISC